MNAKWIIALAALIAIAVIARTHFGDRNAYAPAPIPGAQVQLTFEGDLENLGSAPLTGQSKDGPATYKRGPTGQAHHAQGDGSVALFEASEMAGFADIVEISFDFKADDWTNPYKKGVNTKTMVVISGQSGGRIRHLTFNLSDGGASALYASLESVTGTKHRLKSNAGAATLGWHNVRLRVNRTQERSQLYLDGEMIAEARLIPSVFENGVDQIKIGTWHKQNQAYRGLIDNLVIRDVDG